MLKQDNYLYASLLSFIYLNKQPLFAGKVLVPQAGLPVKLGGPGDKTVGLEMNQHTQHVHLQPPVPSPKPPSPTGRPVACSINVIFENTEKKPTVTGNKKSGI